MIVVSNRSVHYSVAKPDLDGPNSLLLNSSKPVHRPERPDNPVKNQQMGEIMAEKDTSTLLNQEQQTICQDIAAKKSGIDSQRAEALLAVDSGQTQAKAAEISGLTAGQVRYLITNFKKKGLDIFPEELRIAKKPAEKEAPVQEKKTKAKKEKPAPVEKQEEEPEVERPAPKKKAKKNEKKKKKAKRKQAKQSRKTSKSKKKAKGKKKKKKKKRSKK